MTVALLPVGDYRRPRIARALLLAVGACCLLLVFLFVAKQVAGLYAHTPWMDDPYDTFVSFSEFFVPVVVILVWLRMLSCRRNLPLPTKRVRDLFRGVWIALGAGAVTLAMEWASVVLHDNAGAWNGVTGGLVAVLGVATAAVGVAFIVGVRTVRLLDRPDTTPEESDWFGDVLFVLSRRASWLGPFSTSWLRLLAWTDLQVIERVRRHPLVAAGALACAFGLAVAGSQAIEEGLPSNLAVPLLFFGVTWCGMYVFIVLGGAYLGVVSHGPRSRGLLRRLTDAFVVACAAVPLALAFRGSMNWLVNTGNARGGPEPLIQLLLIVGIMTFIIVIAAESLWTRVRSRR